MTAPNTKIMRLVRALAVKHNLRITDVALNNHTKATVQHIKTGRRKLIVFSASPRNETVLLHKVNGYLKKAEAELGRKDRNPSLRPIGRKS
jgi:hypothetical protein